MELFILAKIYNMNVYEIYYAMLIMGRKIATTMPGDSSEEELLNKAKFAISLAINLAADSVQKIEQEMYIEDDLESLLKDIEL